MKKDLLIRLLSELTNDWNYKSDLQLLGSEEIENFANILSLTDEQVLDVLSTKDLKLKKSKLYLYLKGDELDPTLRDMLEKNIEFNNSNVYYVLPLIKPFKELNRDDIISFANIIINAEERFKAEYTSAVAENQNILRRDDALEIVKVIAGAETEDQAKIVSQIATNEKVLVRDDALKIVKTLINVEKYKLWSVSDVATDPNILKRNDTLQIIKEVLKARDAVQISYACLVATDYEANKRDDLLKFIKIIINTEKAYQAEHASYVAINEDVLERKDAPKLVSIVANAKNFNLAEYARAIITDSDILKRKDMMEFLNLMDSFVDNGNAEYVSATVTHPNISTRDDALEIAKLIATAKTYLHARSAWGVLTNPIIHRSKILERDDILDIIKLITNAKGYSQAGCAADLINCYSITTRDDALELIKLMTNAEDDKELITKDAIVEYIIKPESDLVLIGIRKNVSEKKVFIYQEKNIGELMNLNNCDTLIEALKSSGDEEVNLNTKVKMKIRNKS